MIPGNLGDDSIEENIKVGTNEDHVSSSNNDESEDLDESNLDSTQSEVQEETQLRRTTRERRPSTGYSQDEFITLTDEGEPQSYEEAMIDNHKAEWAKAMCEEM